MAGRVEKERSTNACRDNVRKFLARDAIFRLISAGAAAHVVFREDVRRKRHLAAKFGTAIVFFYSFLGFTSPALIRRLIHGQMTRSWFILSFCTGMYQMHRMSNLVGDNSVLTSREGMGLNFATNVNAQHFKVRICCVVRSDGKISSFVGLVQL